MKRIVKAVGRKLNRAKRTYAAFVMCATTALALPAQTFTTLDSFNAGNDPTAALVQSTDGSLNGTTLLGGGSNFNGTIFKITVNGTLTTLYNFCSKTGCTDGFSPSAALVQATGGEFYGVTSSGGANVTPYGFGAGTIFKITPGGALKTIYNFCSKTGAAVGQM